MVANFVSSGLNLVAQSVLWADGALPARIDGATRAKMLAALAGLVILGFGAVILIWLGARMTRRYMHSGQPLPKTTPLRPDDWADKPLKPSKKNKPSSPNGDA